MISVAANELYHLIRRKHRHPRPDDDDKTTRQTFIVLLFQDVQWIMRELGSVVDDGEAKTWALLVHETLTRQSTRYHSVVHVYELSAGASPLRLLATVFRHSVCLSVDGDISARQREIIEGVFGEGTCMLSPNLYNVRVKPVASVFVY